MNLLNFSEDYAALLLRKCPKALELFAALASVSNEDGIVNMKISHVTKLVYNRKVAWNHNDAKARDFLVEIGLLEENSVGEYTIVYNKLTAKERFDLYMGKDMYEDLLSAVEDDTLRRKAMMELLLSAISSNKFRTSLIKRMGLEPDDVLKHLEDAKINNPKRYNKIVESFNKDEKDFSASLIRMKMFKVNEKSKKDKPKGNDEYSIPDNVKLINDQYWMLVTVDDCIRDGHVDSEGNEIPIDRWGAFQFSKLFLDCYREKFGSDYPVEDGVLIKKRFNYTKSMKEKRNRWFKQGSRTSRLLGDISSVMSTLKDKEIIRDYIKWWFSKGVTSKKAEYTSGWLKSPLMISAFHSENDRGGKNSLYALAQSVPGLKEVNYGRLPETISDLKLLIEDESSYDEEDPRKIFINKCKANSII